MEFLKLLFWILLFVVFYTYIGYGIILYLLVRIKRFLTNTRIADGELEDYPELTLLIPAYNERDYVDKKMRNTMNQSIG